MRTLPIPMLLAIIAFPSTSGAQAVISGRLFAPRTPGSAELMPLSPIWAFASLDGSASQAISFRTWETQPAGWYRLAGPAGNYTLVFSTPAHFMRPIVRTNLYLGAGETIALNPAPLADYAVFHEGAWDDKRATDYYQTFIARGTSLTSVGFRLAHDGVDGGGPGSQNLLVSVHRKADGTPDNWPQVGPTVPVIDVDSGGAKNYIWSAGWNSGEVPLTPGQTYAIHLRAEKAGNTFQAFWMPSDDKSSDCYRLGVGETGWRGRKLWMSIGTDGDGMVIPYNKRIHKQFVALTKFAPKWSQTYVAQGRSLCGVVLYAACSGVQPSMNRQRVAVRVREGGPAGRIVGIEKIAIGNANYTGDASWGAWMCAFAPGEVPLEPGKTYAIEFESIENYQTLHGFVNIKGQMSDDKPGFNPYRKHERDEYKQGRAYFRGTDPVDFSLDMQVIEYANAAERWSMAMEKQNLVRNGDMQGADLDPWKPFTLKEGTGCGIAADGQDSARRFVRITGQAAVDGGLVQRIEGWNRLETYRLLTKVRCSYAVDDKRAAMVGFDPTGQIDDVLADTIVWTLVPNVHGLWVDHISVPIRPKKDAISIWLRGKCDAAGDAKFKADFDDVGLRQVRTGTP